MQLREERESKRASMDGRHEYILSTVADRLRMSLEDAEEFMIDGDQVYTSTLSHVNIQCYIAMSFLFFSA